jgi:hypothetical protein
MEFNDLLHAEQIDPATVLVFRHSPKEQALLKVMPWFIAEKPQIFNAYQQTQNPRVQKQMEKAKYVAAFFAHGADKAAFIGLYERKGQEWLSVSQLRKKPEHCELLKHGLDDSGPKRFWFDLKLTDFYPHWKGKLIIQWPRPAIVWSRWAHMNQFLVDGVVEESVFTKRLSEWRELVFSWDELELIPTRWKEALRSWHGVYYIWDGADQKGYVGSACGAEGIYGRWINYAKSGDGGNKLLKLRKPDQFRFSILEWTPPDVEGSELLRRERFWKIRLHTHAPFGLNVN